MREALHSDWISPEWDPAPARKPVYQILEETAARFPDAQAIEFMGTKYSYSDLADLVSRAAKGLQDLGVKPGVHVGLFLPNSPHYTVAFLGVLRAGGTVVNYSPLDAERTLEHKIDDSRTDILVTLDLAELYPRVQGFLGSSRLKRIVVGSLTDMGGVGIHGAEARSVPVDNDDPHQQTFSSLLDNNGGFRAYPVGEPASALAVLQYTGGTTGAPKGAMLTHANLSCATEQMADAFDGFKLASEKILAVLPPFHIYSMIVNMLFGIRLGAELYLHLRFDPERILKQIHDERITILPAVPTMFIGLVNHPAVDRYDLTSLIFCNSGGAPLPQEVKQRFQRISGCRLGEGWGMTETASAGTMTSPTGPAPPTGSCGRALPGVHLKVVPLANNSASSADGRGEICVTGPNVMTEYWNSPEATQASRTVDGFFRTGDVGYIDDQGFVFIVDRTKDMILCGGYNVYPRTIEEAIYEHESVEEVSVIGITDAYRGQSPMAFIKLKEGREPFSLDELKAFLAPRLGKHEMVHAIEIRDGLPKTPVGKLSKKELYDETASLSL